MLNSSSKIPCPEAYKFHLYQTDNEITQNHNVICGPLTVGINGAENSTEDMINQLTPFSSRRQKNSSDWLKRLLIGVSVLTGAGALATGGYYCYVSGRAITRQISQGDPLVTDDFLISSLPVQVNNQQVVANITHIGRTSHSPYSYYENNKNVTSIISDYDFSTKPVTTNRSEIFRNSHSKNIINSDYYPLNDKLKKQLQLFCLSLVNDSFISPSSRKLKSKCVMLKIIVEKIYYFKNIILDLQSINSGGELLSVEERDNEIFIRRKLTTLYLAAETIMSGKKISRFYIDAMEDNKNYTLEELTKREEIIINYFSTLQPTDAC